VLGAAWSEIDLDTKTWKVLAKRSETKAILCAQMTSSVMASEQPELQVVIFLR